MKIPTLKNLRTAVAEDWIREYKHDSLPLIGFVYSFNCEKEGHWNEITKYARGIVFNQSGDLIALPFPKFFNLNQHETTRIENLPNTPFTVTTKEDGSLIIIFNYNGKWIASTKGSFHSDQANWANDWISKNDISHFTRNENVTLLFEGIYPSNRIVVDYGNFTGLKFLAAFNRESCIEYTNDFLTNIDNFPVPKIYNNDLETIINLCKTLKGVENEGFVLKYENGLRVKIKCEDYKAVHRLISGASPLAVWEALSDFDGQNVPSVKSDCWAAMPDEFMPKVTEYEKELRNNYENLLNKVKSALEEAKKVGSDKKSICIFLQNYDKNLLGMCVSLMDEKYDRLDKAIKDRIRPTGNQL